MKKILLLVIYLAFNHLNAQNGFATYSSNIVGGSTPASESAIFIDNAGNKWVGFSSAAPTSAVAFGVYTNSTSTWTFWNKTTTPVLPSNKVNCFAQDNSGNIWIGTPGGLVKYNGTGFTVYTTANGLPNNTINSLDFISNMLYIGTQTGGLSRYDGLTFTNYNVANTLLPVNLITSIKAENQNNIWLTSGINLVHFFINSTYTSTSYTTSVPSPTTTMNKIYIDATGNKWINSANGVLKFDNIGFTGFTTMYPNFTGASINTNSDLVKGPNNGILITCTSGSITGLTELLSFGNYNFYFPPSSYKLGASIANNISGVSNITGTVTVSSSTFIPSVYTFSYSNFSPVKAFGLGTGVNQNNYKYLDANRVKAGILNRGDMWCDLGGTFNPSYEVPKGAVPNGGVHSGLCAALWMGGLDASNQLHTSAQTYRQTGNDFWPGPLDTTNAFIDTLAAYNYDKIWKIDYNDINTFITQFNLGNVPLTYTPVPDILNWPAKGTGAKTRNMAPFVDVNGNGIYDPLVGGDYPKIKGDQALYYIFNDNLATHGVTGGLPFGVEVHAMAYAYGCPMTLTGKKELAYTTFYDYKIYNRSNNNYNNVYVGFWTEVDIGCYQDDYISSSVPENLGFCYNATNNDNSCAGINSYQSYPPAAGTTVLKGPLAPISDGIDNDNDNTIDEAGEECLMNVFDYYNNNIGSFPAPTRNPITKYHYYNFLKGNWRDSTMITCGGTGYGGITQTKYVYPWTNYVGNPCGTWTEITAGNLSGDRKYIVSSGPFNLTAKSNIEVEYAYVWAVDSSASSNVHIASANKLITDVQKVRTFYSTTPSNCLLSINVGLNQKLTDDQISIYPNPVNSTLNIKTENNLGRSVITITDVLGKTLLQTKNDNLHTASLNIEYLSSGVYLLNVKSEKGLITKKFIKE